MSLEVAIAVLLVWVGLNVAVVIVAIVAAWHRERWVAAHNYLQGYVVGVKHARDGFVVVEPPEGVDIEVFKRAFR